VHSGFGSWVVNNPGLYAWPSEKMKPTDSPSGASNMMNVPFGEAFSLVWAWNLVPRSGVAACPASQTQIRQP
jgi:hypothetical protein